MDADVKKTVLRMIPYGIYVLTAEDDAGNVGAATINFVTQSSFDPPLVVLGVKADSGPLHVMKASGHFALNMLGQGQQEMAFTFFRPAEHDGNTINGEAYQKGSTGSPVLETAPACVECRLVEIVEQGDHHIVIGEVIDARLTKHPEGRPDEAILHMKDLGEKVFYGG